MTYHIVETDTNVCVMSDDDVLLSRCNSRVDADRDIIRRRHADYDLGYDASIAALRRTGMSERAADDLLYPPPVRSRG